MSIDIEKELKSYIEEYENYKTEQVNRFKEVQLRGLYSMEGLRDEAAKMERDLETKRTGCINRFSSSAEQLKKNFLNEYSKKPENYDIKLNTVIALITAAGADADEADYRKWLSPFKYDYESMLTLSKVIKSDFKHILSGYTAIKDIADKMDDICKNPYKYFSAPSVNFNGAVLPSGSAINGAIAQVNTNLTFAFLCAEFQPKIDNVENFIENFDK